MSSIQAALTPVFRPPTHAPCPQWCAGNCTGGHQATTPSGVTVTVDTAHEKVLNAFVAADGDSYRGQAKIAGALSIERYDTAIDVGLEPPSVTRATLLLERLDEADDDCMRVDFSARQLRELAAAAIYAALLLDAANL